MEFSAQAMLVTDHANVRYLTGFAGVAARLLLLPDRVLLMTDGRYRTEALRTISAPHLSHNRTDVLLPDEWIATITRALSPAPRLVVEGDSMSVADFNSLRVALSGVELIPAGDIVLEERVIKDSGELARIRAAGAISDAAFDDLLAAEPLGWSELEVASFLVERMREIGADRAAFEPIVATGERSALAHSRPSKHRLAEDTIVLIDFGAEVDGYKADMTRTLWWGDPPKDLTVAFDAVLEAYGAAVRMLRPGVRVGSVDEAARGVLRERGLEQFVVHPSGHNIGLDIHEQPFLTPTHSGELAVGNVLTVEPGVYIPDRGGLRLEDTFVVTDRGPVALTTATRSGLIRRHRVGRCRADIGPLVRERSPERAVQSDDPQLTRRFIDADKLDDHKRFLIGDEPPWPADSAQDESTRGRMP